MTPAGPRAPDRFSATIESGKLEPRWRSLIAAALVGLAFAYLALVVPAAYGKSDFAPIYWSARALLDGADPYLAVGPNGSYFRWGWEQLYPLPAVLLALPLAASLSYGPAIATFSGLSMAVLTYAVARDGYRRVPVLLSAAAVVSVLLGQWAPLLTAAAMMPMLGFVLVAKPTIGLALFAYRPSRRAALGAAALVLVSLIVMPSWPAAWVSRVVANTPPKTAPITTLMGPLLLLALLRWRRPEARLLLAMSLIPQTLGENEMLPLFLIPGTTVEALLLAGVTWLSYHLQLQAIDPAAPFIEKHVVMAEYNVGLVYTTALVMLLRRPNEGDSSQLVAGLRLPWRRKDVPVTGERRG